MARKKNGAAAITSSAIDGAEDPAAVSRSRTLVFISHDSRDADLAEVFANLLADVSAGTLKSFRSSDKKSSSGIEFGAEWYKAIMSQLGDATDVVALLTQRSIDRPWILYEAGVAKGKLDTNVLGVALGVPLDKVSTGPFGQFQNCADDEDSLTKLVIQLLQRNPDAAPRPEAIRVLVKVFLEDARKLMSTRGKQQTPGEKDETGAAKLFEEVKAMVRGLPEQIDERINMMAGHSSRRTRRFHPAMTEEFLFNPALSRSPSGAATGWLMFISIFRDDLPWLYEVGIDFYRAIRAGNPSKIRQARSELLSVAKAFRHSSVLRELMGPEQEELYFVVRHLPEIVNRFSRDLDIRGQPAKKAVSETEAQTEIQT